ncbi:hypothetical protein [Methylocella sp. CPCC 101449]|uniref:hypothetical protein n=1 Tax=Methylocella sp. CPCC 101449 TaxID=2987531 RepID=UPI00288FD61B|nr:hypothetical protein [Methylocella sp. CPCC 101449]MDT2024590.1 hypothetical protein [Methylocella sp. CPCC 101449]
MLSHKQKGKPIFTSAHDDEKPLVVIMALLICLIFASGGAIALKAMSEDQSKIIAPR